MHLLTLDGRIMLIIIIYTYICSNAFNDLNNSPCLSWQNFREKDLQHNICFEYSDNVHARYEVTFNLVVERRESVDIIK